MGGEVRERSASWLVRAKGFRDLLSPFGKVEDDARVDAIRLHGERTDVIHVLDATPVVVLFERPPLLSKR